MYAASQHALGRVLTEAPLMNGVWNKHEYSQCLDEQLTARVFRSEPDQTIGFDKSSIASTPADSRTHLSIGEILAMPRPSVGVLEGLKRFAKQCAREESGLMPPDVAMVIYYAAIALAWSRCGQYISELDHQELRRGFEWACSRSWTPPSVRDVLREGIGKLPADGV